MSEKIKAILDELFRGIKLTEEAKAVYDELLDNCQEHYQDMISGGLSEAEACQAVEESLQGMREVLDQFEKEPEETSLMEEFSEKISKTEPMQDPNTIRISADQIQTIHVESMAHNVQVKAVDGTQIVIHCEKMKTLDVRQEEDLLTIKTIRIEEEISEAVEEATHEKIDGITLPDLVQQVTRFVSRAARTVMKRLENGCLFDDTTICIEIPRTVSPELIVNSKSGDIYVDQIESEKITLQSASGDVELVGGRDKAEDHVKLSTASGDVTVTRAWMQEAEFSSMSGDVNAEGDFGILHMKSVSGDAQFNGTAALLGIRSISGDVNVTMIRADQTEIRAENTSGGVDIDLPEDHAAVHAEYSTVSGDITNTWPDGGEDAPVQIRAKTISGDIDIR